MFGSEWDTLYYKTSAPTSGTTHCSNYCAQLLSATCILHIEEFLAVLLHAGNEIIKQLFYIVMCSLMMDQ